MGTLKTARMRTKFFMLFWDKDFCVKKRNVVDLQANEIHAFDRWVKGYYHAIIAGFPWYSHYGFAVCVGENKAGVFIFQCVAQATVTVPLAGVWTFLKVGAKLVAQVRANGMGANVNLCPEMREKRRLRFSIPPPVGNLWIS
jgi:hypothetical protein